MYFRTLEAVEFLVDKYGTKILCEKDDNGHTAAHWACLGGHLNIIKYMVESGVSVNISSSSHIGAYPIHWACVEGHVSIVDFLLKVRYSVSLLFVMYFMICYILSKSAINFKYQSSL